MERPNILFIMDDQHRFDFLGVAGADFVKTPNIDRLAARGMYFPNCTVNSPVCAPSRIALATGLQAQRVAPRDNQSFLSHTQTTYYQRLRDHDYYVGCAGKLDLGKPDGYNGVNGDRPATYRWGFTHPIEIEGKMHAARLGSPRGPYGHYLQEQGLFEAFCKDYYDRFLNPESRGVGRATSWVETGSHDSVLPTEAFSDTYIGRRAIQWLEEIPDDFPWHFFINFVGPHDPFDPPTEYADKYRNAEMPAAIDCAPDGKPAWIQAKYKERDPKNTAMVRRQYCAMIELIDDYIGYILDTLEKRGMMENTIIVFSSDHGEMLGDHGLYQKNLPYESALRVPLIIAGPGIQEGVVSDALVELIDLNPTICELAGLPEQPYLDAKSLVPVLQGASGFSHRDDTVSSLENMRLLRTRTHKYVNHINDRNELYDLENDPNETVNLIDQEPELVEELKQRLNERMYEGKWLR
ncbi:MAG: sulfatase-like hydrolase/transferase [Chloroflexota bacterium]